MASTISARGEAFAEKRPVFFDVLDNLWNPESNPNGIVNIGLAENALLHSELVNFINTEQRIDPHALTYGDSFSGSKALRQALSRFLNRKFSPHKQLLPSNLLVTAGSSNAIECCAWGLFNQGDYVLIGRPFWGAFNHLFGTRAGVNIIEVSFGQVDPLREEGVRLYEEAYKSAIADGKRVKAILLCSPHNPLGRCYSRAVLESYMKFCNTNSLHLISDEIYALSVWDNPRVKDNVGFTSVLSIDASQFMNPSMVHVVWGLSKDFGATGIRIGCLISQENPAFLNSAEGISLFNFPSSFADSITTKLLTNDDAVDRLVSLNQSRLAESYKFVTNFLQEHGIPYKESNACLFVLVNLAVAIKGEAGSDNEIYSKLLKEGVYISAGSTYACEEEGWFRLVIAHPRNVLEEGLKRIVSAIL